MLPKGVRTIRNEQGRLDVLIDDNSGTVWEVLRMAHGHAAGFRELTGSAKAAILKQHPNRVNA
jgi:hypothetical protein